MSPLMYACREGRVKVVSKLLDNNANINKQDSRGWTVSGGMFPIIPYFFSRTPKYTCIILCSNANSLKSFKIFYSTITSFPLIDGNFTANLVRKYQTNK